MEPFGKQFPPQPLPAALAPKWNKFLAWQEQQICHCWAQWYFHFPSSMAFISGHTYSKGICNINNQHGESREFSQRKTKPWLVFKVHFFLCVGHHCWNILEINFQTSKWGQIPLEFGILGLLTDFFKDKKFSALVIQEQWIPIPVYFQTQKRNIEEKNLALLELNSNSHWWNWDFSAGFLLRCRIRLVANPKCLQFGLKAWLAWCGFDAQEQLPGFHHKFQAWEGRKLKVCDGIVSCHGHSFQFC